MFFFKHKANKYCIDATKETGYYGRLVNHSRVHANCVAKVVELSDQPHLVLIASRDINKGEELLYDYGDQRSHVIMHHPWLKGQNGNTGCYTITAR